MFWKLPFWSGGDFHETWILYETFLPARGILILLYLSVIFRGDWWKWVTEVQLKITESHKKFTMKFTIHWIIHESTKICRVLLCGRIFTGAQLLWRAINICSSCPTCAPLHIGPYSILIKTRLHILTFWLTHPL